MDATPTSPSVPGVAAVAVLQAAQSAISGGYNSVVNKIAEQKKAKRKIMQLAIETSYEDAPSNEFQSPIPPVKRHPAWKSRAMSKNTYTLYVSSEDWEKRAGKLRRKAGRAQKKAQARPESTSRAEQAEKKQRDAEFTESGAKALRRMADRAFRTEIFLTSTGISKRLREEAGKKAAFVEGPSRTNSPADGGHVVNMNATERIPAWGDVVMPSDSLAHINSKPQIPSSMVAEPFPTDPTGARRPSSSSPLPLPTVFEDGPTLPHPPNGITSNPPGLVAPTRDPPPVPAVAPPQSSIPGL